MRLTMRLPVLLCLTMFAVSGLLHAQSYPTVVVFGDSLSDTGNVAHLTQSQFAVRYPGVAFNYADGRFTDSTATTPAASAYAGVWVEQMVAQFAARPAVTDSLDGGTNYAYGDATTQDGYQTVSIGAGVSLTITNMGQQIANYLAVAPMPLKATTLYVVFGGANDLYADSSTAGVTAAAQREATLVQRLINAGATQFLVPNLPPIGSVPEYTGTSSQATLNSAAALFRTLLASDLQAITTANKAVTIYQPDLYSLFGSLASNPTSYGLANVTVSAQGLTTPTGDVYLFWDDIHPTTTGHHFIASAAENLLSPLVASSTALTVSPGVATSNQTVMLKAVVTGTGPTTKPSGLVTFFSGTGNSATSIGLATLDATGTGTATFLPTSAGSPYSLTAVYAGDTAYLNSTSTAQALVIGTPLATSTTLSTTSKAINLGAAVTFTGMVTAATGTPSGMVTFYSGSASLGTATLSGGMGSLTTTALPAGTDSITAVYTASGAYAGSSSSATAVVVTSPSVAVSFSPSSLTVTHGSAGSVTVSVTPAGGVSGSVTLSCGTLPAHISCMFTPATVTLSGTAVQTSTLTIGTTAMSALEMPGRPGSFGRGLAIYACSLLPLFGFLSRRKRRAGWRSGSGLLLGFLLLGAMTLSLAGCSGSSPASSTTATPGTYNVVVTATVSGGTTATSLGTLSVVVQ